MTRKLARSSAVLLGAVLLTTGTMAAPALAAEIDGTGGNDTLRGTKAADVMRGFGGHDDLDGRGGDDELIGGRGANSLIGRGGDDVLRSGPDRAGDRTHFLFGGPKNDTGYGGRGHDFMNGGRGHDAFWGRSGRDSAHPGPGRDVIRLGKGRDYVDSLTHDGSIDVFYCGPGDDVIGYLAETPDPLDEFHGCETVVAEVPS